MSTQIERFSLSRMVGANYLLADQMSQILEGLRAIDLQRITYHDILDSWWVGDIRKEFGENWKQEFENRGIQWCFIPRGDYGISIRTWVVRNVATQLPFPSLLARSGFKLERYDLPMESLNAFVKNLVTREVTPERFPLQHELGRYANLDQKIRSRLPQKKNGADSDPISLQLIGRNAYAACREARALGYAEDNAHFIIHTKGLIRALRYRELGFDPIPGQDPELTAYLDDQLLGEAKKNFERRAKNLDIVMSASAPKLLKRSGIENDLFIAADSMLAVLPKGADRSIGQDLVDEAASYWRRGLDYFLPGDSEQPINIEIRDTGVVPWKRTHARAEAIFPHDSVASEKLAREMGRYFNSGSPLPAIRAPGLRYPSPFRGHAVVEVLGLESLALEGLAQDVAAALIGVANDVRAAESHGKKARPRPELENPGRPTQGLQSILNHISGHSPPDPNGATAPTLGITTSDPALIRALASIKIKPLYEGRFEEGNHVIEQGAIYEIPIEEIETLGLAHASFTQLSKTRISERFWPIRRIFENPFGP